MVTKNLSNWYRFQNLWWVRYGNQPPETLPLTIIIHHQMELVHACQTSASKKKMEIYYFNI